MNKAWFLSEIKMKMEQFPDFELQETLDYYNEIIDDKIESGMSEEEAIFSLGKVDEILKEMIYEMPITSILNSRIKPKPELNKIQMFFIGLVMLIGALPVFIVLFSLYLSIWAVIGALYFTNFVMLLSSLLCIMSFVFHLFMRNWSQSMLSVGLFFLTAGLSILMFYGMNFVSVYLVDISKKYMRWIKSKLA